MNTQNIIISAIGVIMLVVGFIFLATPGDETVGTANNPLSLTAAPIILCIAYLIVIPVGILWKRKKKDGSDLTDGQ